MTVEELINELMATCDSLHDEVVVCGSGPVTRVSKDTDAGVSLNDYPVDANNG